MPWSALAFGGSRTQSEPAIHVDRIHWGGVVLRVFLVAVTLSLLVSGLEGQSVSGGTIRGAVQDSEGRPLGEVRIELRDSVTGQMRVLEPGASGQFLFTFLSPGVYEVLAEQIGYVPVRTVSIPALPGREVRLTVVLPDAEPPVDAIEVRPYDRRSLDPGWQGLTRPFTDLELSGLPHVGRDLAQLGRFSSATNSDLEFEGLPSHLGGVFVDGIPYAGAVHPGLPSGTSPTEHFALSAFEHAQLASSGIDVEWAEFTSGFLSGTTRRGTRDFDARVFGDWSGRQLAGSKFFAPDDVKQTNIRGGVQLSGPIVRDSAHVVVGAEGGRLETPMPRAWVNTTADSELVSVAADSFGVDLSPYLRPRVMEKSYASGFARFDWQMGSRHTLSIRGNGSRFTMNDPVLGRSRIPTLGHRVEGTDVSAGATLTSRILPSLAVELRAGLEVSQREYQAGTLPASVLLDQPIAFGTDGALPGTFERVGFRARQTLHFEYGEHLIKFGGAATLVSLDHAFEFGRGGESVFGGVDDLAREDGYFAQAVGRVPPSARFSAPRFAGFLQDTWRATPGFQVIAGVRVDVELLPKDDVRINTDWDDRTKLAIPDSLQRRTVLSIGPRLGFVWDIGARQRSFVRAGFGLYHGGVDPGVLAELVSRSPGVDVRRGVGVGSWPVAPDSVAAPVIGQAITILHPDFEGPRTFRASFGFTGAIGSATTLNLSAAYRHTDFLPRRHDLNLIPAPTGQDQYGRALYGQLVQRGSLVAAMPGSNRRFNDFDVVSALDPDGYSDYRAVTVRLERRVAGGVRLSAGYTYSRTEDNWLAARGGGTDLQLTPFPDSLAGGDWADGRSDLDSPHRFVLGAEVHVGVVRLAGLYRVESALPFTPGFRDGVDANGDGSGRNDPAFIDDQITGMPNLLAEWECLSAQVGQFAERNSCRGPSVKRLDLRLTITALRVGQTPIDLVIDGLNLVESDAAELDRAVVLVDRQGTLATDPATGRVTVPLVANSNFGKPILRRTTGRMVRVGFRINYE